MPKEGDVGREDDEDAGKEGVQGGGVNGEQGVNYSKSFFASSKVL